jgi:salicylate hydroxylase
MQGQGAGQAIEDAYVLSGLFGHVDTPEKIPLAFEAYDKIRRPRSVKVITTSREMGEMCALRLPGVGDDAAKFKENVDWRMEWLWHRDIALELEEAVQCFEKLVGGGSLS